MSAAAQPVSLARRLLPAAGDAAYGGSPAAAHFLALLALLTIVPGCIHSFLPDGGAGVIAGIDLGACRQIIVALFAWAGATQIAFGIAMLLAATRYRALVPLLLALVALERSLHAVHFWSHSPGPGGHRPPEHYAVLVGVPLVLIALVLSLRQRPPRGA